MAAVVLDSGGVIAFAVGDKDVAALIKDAALAGVEVLMPPIVVTETVRGGGRDAPLFRLLRQGCKVPATDFRIARTAGELLGKTGGANAPDAQVAAHCMDAEPATLITGDPSDMRVLLQDIAGVRIRAV